MVREDYLFRKVHDINILRRAWHLARYDSKTDFIEDPYRNEDYAFNIEANLTSLSNALRKDEYHPSPLLNIDVPKSTLSVRPGSKIYIEDKIVLFAITILIAPKLDKELPEGVYSFRLKKEFDEKTLFKDIQFLRFPFLKEKTIKREVVIFEQWYSQYPKFIEDSIYAYEEEGYNYLTLSDITSYFENINLNLLQSTLINYLPKNNHKIINLLCSLLRYWTFPTVYGGYIERGIPQGNEVSSFLGNIYLLPLDKEINKFCKKKNAKYFRYVDDIKIFSKEEYIAREAIFEMNKVLRNLHLNIQGSKTSILKDKEIFNKLFDSRMVTVNKIIDEIQINRNNMDKKLRNELLKKLIKENIRKRKITQKKDLMLYKRLITAFTLLDSSYMIKSILSQLPKNPDAGLTEKAVRYFKLMPRNYLVLAKELLKFLELPINIFVYQKANIIDSFRYFNEINSKVVKYCRLSLRKKQEHWYVRSKCALLLSNLNLVEKSLVSLLKIFNNESNVELKKSLISSLCQLEKNKLNKFLQELMNDNNKKIYSIGRMLTSLYRNYNNKAIEEIDNIFRNYDENVLANAFYKIEVIKHCKKFETKKYLLVRLRSIRRKIKKKHLKEKVERTIVFLNRSIQKSL
ncbi:MAG: RNA-directed DNA polymerase [Actinobacteria bacterium]|nr:RNA-directed DNA polymerase [Actinomycetota bacterium]